MTIPESELHSYIDGELSDEERAAILAQMRVCADLVRQVAELQLLKELIQAAYPPSVQAGQERDACS